MRKEVALWSTVVLVILGTTAFAGQPRPFVGVRLDAGPLPELLTKHLRLDPGQGLRINNIMRGSPADQAGLERDDIIFALDGQKVTSLEQFIELVGKAGIGTQVTLEVLHLGQRQAIHVKLVPPPENVEWKYPAEPDAVTVLRPGKVWGVGPGGQGWIEIRPDQIPNVDFDLKSFLKESYTYQHTTGGESYTITIEGSPKDNESRVIIRSESDEHTATVGALDALPEKYREPAQQAVKDACSSVSISIGGVQLPDALNPRKLLPNLARPDLDRLAEQKDLALEKLRDQVQRLQQQMKEMEEYNRQMLDKLLRKNETKPNPSAESQPTPEPSLTTPGPSI